MKGVSYARAVPHRGFVVELTDLDALDHEAWDDLTERAARDAHPHYTRHVVEAHRVNGLAPAKLTLVAIRRDGRLEALLPCVQVFDPTGLGRRVAAPLSSHVITSTAPLVARDTDPDGVGDALVHGLSVFGNGRSWRWPQLSVETPSGAALVAAMRRSGWALAETERFDRPVLDRRASHAAFLDRHPHAGRLKDLRRRSRRLAEAGSVAFETATDGAGLAWAVETFLRLERAGWKGRAGTAMACRKTTAGLARTLFAAGARGVGVRADVLRLDGAPVAVSLALVHAGTACLLKATYDESLRQFAPGLVLEAEIVRALHETGFARRLDSATAPGSALESLYRDREAVADLIAVPPEADPATIERRLALARLQGRLRADAKRIFRSR